MDAMGGFEPLEALLQAIAPERGGPSGAERVPHLTGRQRQVLELVRLGRKNREIASEMGIGLTTVERHLSRAFKRLGVQSRTQAVLALERHLAHRERPESRHG
jgi:DNA-binding NarL/FixJ family response regulator